MNGGSPTYTYATIPQTVAPAPVAAAPAPAPVVQAAPPAPAPVAAEPEEEPRAPRQTARAAPRQTQPPQRVTPGPALEWEPNYSLPPATVKPAMPPANSYHVYRVQVGAYKSTVNAREAFDHLVILGFTPAYERYGEMYRVVLSGIRARDMPEAARLLGYAGFREVIIREEK
ncbi:MAG: SPOR domain-containing protein [Treponema sp.]|nr:SPOR domain-containing protein [Treponema sp.]